jgi:DNA-binding transcriptional MocR family regulator
MDMLEATLRQSAPRLAYSIPDHHNPTGLQLGDEGRERLVALARAHRTPFVIDETMVGLELDVPAPPPVATHDLAGETAITIGSMSKAFWAGLRIGWIRTSPGLVRRLSTARAAVDLSSPVVEQLVATELLNDADAILEARRHAVRPRRDALVSALRDELPEWRFDVPTGGLVLWAELDAPRSSALAAIADSHGVRVAPGPRFGIDGTFENRIRLPYCLPEATLEDAATRLAAAWRAVTEGAPAPDLEPAFVT